MEQQKHHDQYYLQQLDDIAVKIVASVISGHLASGGTFDTVDSFDVVVKSSYVFAEAMMEEITTRKNLGFYKTLKAKEENP